MASIALTHKKSLYETILLNMLGKMEKGNMEISLPTGETFTIGNGEGSVNANINIKNKIFSGAAFSLAILDLVRLIWMEIGKPIT